MHKASLARKNADAHDALLALADELASYFDLAADVQALRDARPSPRDPAIGMLKQREALVVLLQHVCEKLAEQALAELDGEQDNSDDDTEDNDNPDAPKAKKSRRAKAGSTPEKA